VYSLPFDEDESVWAEYGARVGHVVSEAVTLGVLVNAVSGEDHIDSRVHGGGELRYRF
jgi:hypothetical protein